MSRKRRENLIPKIDINDLEELQGLYSAMYPGGSGPLSTQRCVTGLIEAIAKEKGFELVKPR